jgi:phospholipid/cholesterol/gamma-HCH transport system substrate-binding protein
MKSVTKTRMRRARSILFGALALGLFAGAIWLTGYFLQGGLQEGIPVSAEFSAPGVGQQLPEGGDVKVRGVLVGTIASIELGEDGDAVVEMLLDPDEELPSDSRAEVRSKTAFGQKWIELIPDPDSTALAFAEDDVIPDSRTKEPLELERALELGHDLLGDLPLRDLSALLKVLANSFEGSEGDASNAIDQGLVALRAANASAPDLEQSIEQLGEFSKWLDENDSDILSFLRSVDRANRALVGAAPEFSRSLDSVPKFLNRFTSFQELTEKDLTRLIQKGATFLEFLETRRDDFTDIVMQLQPFTTVWNSMLQQPCGGLYEQDMVCWHVYQPPGLESRGLFKDGQAPVENDPTDPLVQIDQQLARIDRLQAQLRKVTKTDTSDDLARILLEPVAEELPELGAAR